MEILRYLINPFKRYKKINPLPALRLSQKDTQEMTTINDEGM